MYGNERDTIGGVAATPQIEIYESFPKQTYRNRCVILSPRGERLTLSVPVKRAGSKQLTRDVEISYESNWQHVHSQAILSAYKRTPYFDYYQDYILPLYQQQFRFLLDLNSSTAYIAEQLLRNQPPKICRKDGGTRYEGQQNDVQRTTEWSGQDIEGYWGDGLSILDSLFREGPTTFV